MIVTLLAAACSSSTAASDDSSSSVDASSVADTSSAAASSAGTFLDEGTIHEISIEFDQDDYDDAIAAYQADQSKEWIAATVTIDGIEYTDAGVRLKGNSSLFGLNGDGARGGPGGNANASSPEELPWLIRLDKYVDGQNHNGVYDFVVRSSSSTTALNEAVALDILELAGLASQESAYAAFSVNGSASVLRLVMENPDDVWMAAHFSADGTLYKAEATGDYSYRGDDPDAYDEVFDIEAGDGDLSPLIEFLDFINNSDDETFYAELEQWLDTDSFATYLAAQELIANQDDIDGRGNNSYLYLDPATGEFTIVPWDHNGAFRGFALGVQDGPLAVAGQDGLPVAGADALPAAGGDGFTQLDAGSGTQTTVTDNSGQDGTFPAGGPPARNQGALAPGADAPIGRPNLNQPATGNDGFAGPNAGGPQAYNVLVDRFLADADYAALVDSEIDRLTAELYDSGVAADIVAKWASLLDGSGLVDSTVLENEAANVSSFFT